MENQKIDFSQNEAPDQDSLAGQAEASRVNTQRERVQGFAGARGSNHIGQGSGGDSTHAPVTAKGTEGHNTSEPVRKGNSAQDSKDQADGEDADSDMDISPDAEIEDEMNSVGGTERADMGFTPAKRPFEASGPTAQK